MAATQYEKAVEQMAEMTKALLGHPDIYRLQAEATWKRYQALLKAGFAEGQAVAIVAAQGVGFDVSAK